MLEAINTVKQSVLWIVAAIIASCKGVLGRDSAADKRQQRREYLRWYFSQNAK